MTVRNTHERLGKIACSSTNGTQLGEFHSDCLWLLFQDLKDANSGRQTNIVLMISDHNIFSSQVSLAGMQICFLNKKWCFLSKQLIVSYLSLQTASGS